MTLSYYARVSSQKLELTMQRAAGIDPKRPAPTVLPKVGLHGLKVRLPVQHGQTSHARLTVAQASGGGEVDDVVVYAVVEVICREPI